MKKWILKRLGIDDWDAWIKKRLDTTWMQKYIQKGKDIINKLIEFGATVGRYIEFAWDKLNGWKSLAGFALVGLGYYFDCDEVVEYGFELLGAGILHKLYKAWKEKQNK